MHWTIQHVEEWLDWTVQEFGFNLIDKSNFRLTGMELCALSREEFLKRSPQYIGDVLYSHLNLLKAKGVKKGQKRELGLSAELGAFLLYIIIIFNDLVHSKATMSPKCTTLFLLFLVIPGNLTDQFSKCVFILM